ncbi:hypothetical protein HDV00_005248 [Rhizophlyctis rosea]|nr:hypothetical protein HDV00_005248 [Rhizophlyctis rosea]
MTSTTRPIVEVLTSPTFILPLALSTTLLTTSYFLLPYLLPKTFSTEKSRAWILTFVAAIIMSLASLPFLHSHILLGRFSMAQSPLVDSTFARWTCGFFVAYLLCDLGLGRALYPSQMNFWSGYFHHTLYTFMVIGLLAAGVPGGFCTMGILELPTAVMALGCLDKKFRNDAAFGATFFLTRIVIHAYFIVDLYYSFPGRGLWMVLAGVMPLHVMWFKGWINQQLRKRGERERQKVEILVEKVGKDTVVSLTDMDTPIAKSTILPSDEIPSLPTMEITKAVPTKRRNTPRPRRQQLIPKMRTGASVKEKSILEQNRFAGLVSVASA